nr:hypothetical protein [Desulfobulbaceae bacterium]
MAINTISGSNGSSPVELYKTNQSNNQSSVTREQQADSTQRANKKEAVYSVQISQDAVELQRQKQTQQAETDQKLQADRQVQAQVNAEMQSQRTEAKEYNRQSIDILV